MSNYKALLPKITTFVFDYDGVMTDGVVMIGKQGELMRTSQVKDGYALQLAKKLGYNIAVISGGLCQSIEKRFEQLGINDVYLGVSNKITVLEKYMESKDLKPEEIIYMGDDIPDYRSMKMVGLPVCPADACEEIKSISLYISHLSGGKGCVRDVIEQVLKAQGKWMLDGSHIW